MSHWLGRIWGQAATSVVGKTDAGPHGITEVSKMNPGQSLAQQGLVQGPGLKSRETEEE